MFGRSKYALAIAALLIFGLAPAEAALKVVKIYDGDTITLADGMKIRLLQIDTPELAPGECYADKARTALVNLLAKKGTITLKSDPVSASYDRYVEGKEHRIRNFICRQTVLIWSLHVFLLLDVVAVMVIACLYYNMTAGHLRFRISNTT